MPITEDSGYSSLWELLEFHLTQHGSDVALLDSESRQSVTYDDILRKAFHCSLYLSRSGVKKGDIVAVISKNTVDYVSQILGCLRIGAACALLSARLKRGELEHLLGIIQPSVIIVPVLDDEQSDVVLSAQSARLFFSEAKVRRGNAKCFSIDSLLTGQNDMPLPLSTPLDLQAMVKVEADDTAFILCSSGTTGLPKGVVITHRNMMTTLGYNTVIMPEKRTTLGLMPFCHAYGLGILLMALCQKNPVIVMNNFSLEKLIEVIRKYGVEILHIVPSLLISLSNLSTHTVRHYMASVKLIVTSAGTIRTDQQKRLKDKLYPSAKIAHGFGMTETTFIVIFGELNEVKEESSGRLLPGIYAKVIDDTGTEVATGKRGEIAIRCPMVMKGYYRNERVTKETLDDDGWLRTGDLGFVDEDGFFFIVDRKKEIMKFQGHQISPSEIESVISSVDGVIEVAVIGVEHVFGEVPRAFVVKATDSILTEDDVKGAVCRELTSYKQLRGGVEFVKELPKSLTGKILKRELNAPKC